MMERKEKVINFDNITVHFRWVLPIMLGGYILAYHNDIQWQKERFDDIKQSQQKMWDRVDHLDAKTEKRFAYVYQQCCKAAISPPPD